MMSLLAEILHEESGQDVSQTPLLFGGSVGPTNADEYFAIPNVDGALVGGASVNYESLAAVFDAAVRVWKD